METIDTRTRIEIDLTDRQRDEAIANARRRLRSAFPRKQYLSTETRAVLAAQRLRESDTSPVVFWKEGTDA